jgi:glycosyltransferase involved in cell wall biosynthesis
MSNTPPIAVILPVYNGMRYLKQSVESVLNQDIDDFEFLICDDASADDSFAYLKSIDDKRIQLFRNEKNKGLFPTLNFLARKSQSELIHLWAQDDIMYPDCLSETVKFHKNFPNVNFSFSRLQGINAKGEIIKQPQTFPNKTLSPEGHALSSILYGSISGNIANVCIVKQSAEKVGLFDENMKYAGDFKMWCLLSKEKPIGMNGRILVQVRQHSGQLSKNMQASYYKLVENYSVYQCFLQTLQPALRKPARRALRWKIYTFYFTQYLHILKKRDFKLAKAYRKALARYDNLALLFMRWTVIRFLKLIKQEQRFYKTFFLNQIQKRREV